MPAGAPAGMGPAGPPPPRPASIVRAVLLMRVGAGLSVLSGLTSVGMSDSVRKAFAQAAADRGTPMSGGELDVATSVAVTVGVIGGLIGAGVWLLMAWGNGKGASWARIVATILFAFSLISGLAGLVQPQPVLERILTLLTVLVGAAVIALLYQRESSEFYRASSAPRY